ncbi:Gr6 [Eciton burchellii]|nr:Gr6 [Eciton burchellii]
MFQPKTIQDMMMPLIIANFILGMRIWTTRTYGKVNLVYSLLCVVFYCVLMRLSMVYMKNYHVQKADQLGDIMFQAIFYVNIVLTLCLIPSGWWKGKHMQATLTRIMMCEKAIQEIGIEKNYRKLYLNQLYSFVIIVLMFILYIVINYRDIPPNTPIHIQIILIIATNYPICLLYISDISFLHWVRYAKIRFEQLNNALQRMLTTTPDSPQHKRVLKMSDEWSKTLITSASQQQNRSKTKENTDTMRAVKQIHLELIRSSRTMNDAYGLQILFSMTAAFVFITALLYYAYIILWMNLSKEEFKQEMIPVIAWILFYASKILVINHMCALASTEAANTGDIICELYEPSTSKEFRAEIRDFTLQLIQNPLIFTACGFFNLDNTFIHGVIGSVTTYLVILIQVGDLSNGNFTISNSSITNFTVPDILTIDV